MNNTVKQIFRALGVILSIFLSIALVVMLIVAPMYSVAKSLVKPENITQIIRDIDYTELLLGSITDKYLGETIGEVVEIPPEIKEQVETYIKPITESPIMEEVVEVYAEDITNILNGNATEFTLDEQMLSNIINEHMDEVVELVKENAPEGTTIPEEEIRQTISETVETYGGALIEAMPDAQAIQETMGGLQENNAVSLALDTSVPYVLYGVIALLAVLIFFCLYGGARGLLCLGIDSLIAALFLFAVSSLFGNSGLVTELVGVVPSVGAALTPIIALLASKTQLSAILITTAGVLLIAGYITFKVVKKKRADAALVAHDEPVAISMDDLV